MTKIVEFENLKKSVGLMDPNEIVDKLTGLNDTEQTELLYLLILDDLECSIKYILKQDKPIEYFIRIVKSICFSKWSNHKYVSLLIIKHILNRELNDHQICFIKNKIGYFMNDKEIKIIKEAVECAKLFKHFSDNTLVTHVISLYKSIYESIRVEAVKLLFTLKKDKLGFIKEEMIRDKSYRVRYHLVKESIKAGGDIKNEVIRRLQNDKVIEIQELIYDEKEFYKIANNLIEVFINCFARSGNIDLKSILVKNIIKYTNIFDNRTDLVEKFILNETWEVKQHIFKYKGKALEKYVLLITEKECTLKDRKYSRLLDLLDKLINRKDDIQFFNHSLLRCVISLLENKVHIVRTKTVELLCYITNKFNITCSNVVYLENTIEHKRTKVEEINNNIVEFYSEECLSQILRLKDHKKHQIRDDCEPLLKLLLNKKL